MLATEGKRAAGLNWLDDAGQPPYKRITKGQGAAIVAVSQIFEYSGALKRAEHATA